MNLDFKNQRICLYGMRTTYSGSCIHGFKRDGGSQGARGDVNESCALGIYDIVS